MVVKVSGVGSAWGHRPRIEALPPGTSSAE